MPIRELRTDTVSALYPQEKVASLAGWKTSRVAGDFSALALAFAYELHKELKVPVGILLTSHSNTRIEAFTERKAIEAHPGLKVDADMIHDGDVGTEQGRAAFEQYYQDLAAWQKASAALGFPVERPLKRPGLPGIAGEWRGPSQFFNGKIAPVAPYAKPDTVPTLAYNWCVSPLTPMAVAGVIWVPGQANLGYTAAEYASELEIYARSLPATYGLAKVPFLYPQPSAKLVPGITPPKIENAKAAEFDQWPKSLRELAVQLGTAATDTK